MPDPRALRRRIAPVCERFLLAKCVTSRSVNFILLNNKVSFVTESGAIFATISLYDDEINNRFNFRMMTMKICELMTFATVARCANITAAARELNTVQSNVTTRIRALENHIGLPLLERHSRGVALTGAGQRLLPYAQQAVALLDEAARVARDEGEAQGPLVLGSMETTLAVRLPDVLARFHARYADVQLIMKIDSTAALVERVLNNEVYGAFVAGPIDHPLLSAEQVFEEELVLVTPRRWPTLQAFRMDSQPVTALMFRMGCAYRQRLEQLLVYLGRPSFQRLDFGSLDGILGCIGAGVGITLLPRSVVAKSGLADRLQVHTVDESIARVSTLFIRRREAQQTTTMRLFLDCLREEKTMPIAV